MEQSELMAKNDRIRQAPKATRTAHHDTQDDLLSHGGCALRGNRFVSRSARVLSVATVATVTAGFLYGCTSPFDREEFGPWLEGDPSQWRTTENGSLHHGDTLRNRANQDEAQLLSGGAGADAYAMVALSRNPSILAAQRRVERLGARVPQVTSLDDPMLQVAPFGEMAETAAGQVGLMTGLSQKLPFPGKLDTRGRIAEQDVAMALADLRQTRLQVVADTRQAFWSYYFATRAIETTRQSRASCQSFSRSPKRNTKRERVARPTCCGPRSS